MAKFRRTSASASIAAQHSQDHARHAVLAIYGRLASAATISLSAITYQLRRLRLHGLIERIPKSFRYQVTDFGLRVALFFTRTYNRLLRPGLAAALPALRSIATPLRHAFDALTAQIDTMINQANLAAKNLTHSHKVSFVKQG